MNDRNNKKGLRKRLSAVLLIYMDSLDNKRKASLEKYLDKKLKAIVNYYFDLFSKNRLKQKLASPVADEAELPDSFSQENSRDSTIKESGKNANHKQNDIKRGTIS
jgi:hypothetical protein